MISPLLTDLYQLTMAYGYWKQGRHEEDAVFHLFYRKNPFGGDFTIAAGLQQAVDFLEAYRFSEGDIAFLATLCGNDDKPLFEPGFLNYLADLELNLDIDAVLEGTAMQAHEPLLRVRGPILQGQLIETPLLNMLNFQSLIATKAARVCEAAAGDPVLEFGLRRAQGIDGAMAASRAAYIGGCAATSNVLAGKTYGIPVKGTHAHSWVMCFDDEPAAFAAYADAMPNNCVFLVDTYDTVRGVRYAIAVACELRKRGHEMLGIRLDSGDLCELSKRARELLDEADFPDARIVASNDLDEYAIAELKANGAKIAVWGVGTKLVTAYDQPALGGVYKLGAIARDGGWDYKVKLSEQAIKVSNPGVLQVRRFATGDMIWNEAGPAPGNHAHDLANSANIHELSGPYEDLLKPIFRGGKRVLEMPTLNDARRRVALRSSQACVGLETGLQDLKDRLIAEARAKK
ncbi:MAG: nicotinate phosphoribosyltransferase [Rhodothermales bacterium]|jgi:nicotinate phosphoribosyltransferase